jgi:hypothetical protein
LFVLFITACNTGDEDENLDFNSEVDSLSNTIVKINDKLFSVPSPYQVSMLLKNNKLEYNSDLLHTPNNLHRYNTTFQKAVNVGVYGCDLGYLFSYGKLYESKDYMFAVETLAAELDLSTIFNDKLFEQLEQNQDNPDSVLFIISNVFKNADSYLFANERSEVGALILAGGWVEGLYIITQVSKNHATENIINRIGEQKYPLENVIAILRPFYKTRNEEFDIFLQKLIKLAQVFDGVSTEYVYKEPITDKKNHITEITSESKVLISDYQLNTIRDSVAALRKFLVE